MPGLRIKRGTRAQLDAAATAGQLAAGEPYLITDENRLAVGTSATSYQALAKESEAGGSIANAGAIAWPKRSATPRIVGDVAGTPLATATGLNTGTTGDKSGTLSFTLSPGQIYWASLISSAAATVRALAVGSVQASLGRTANNTTVISYLFAAGSGSTLPATAPTSLTAGTGSCPAIYLLE